MSENILNYLLKLFCYSLYNYNKRSAESIRKHSVYTVFTFI